MVVDAEKCIKDGVRFRTNPSGAILTKEHIMPQCIASMDGSQLWTNISEHPWWKISKVDPDVEETEESRLETPADSEDCSVD